MISWPALKVLSEFAAILSLELLLLFAVAKLIALRLRSAQWQRAVWQITLVSMFLALAGELNGVRGLFARREVTSPPTARTPVVVVTIREPDSSAVVPRLAEIIQPAKPLPSMPAPAKHGWEQPAKWFVIPILALAVLLLLRTLAAQLLTLGFRAASRRWNDAGLSDVVQRLASVLRIERKIKLARSFKANAPFTFGVWRPIIVLPHRFTELFGPKQRQVALAHELAHIADFDSAWRTFGQMLCAILWWNPFVWLAARELDRASELVADEASLLIHDGPEHLAECLVQCARAPRPPALSAWLGMDGGRFRSALGQRVARLLHLNSNTNLSRPVPWFVRILVPLICVVGLWFGAAAIKPFGQSDGAPWRNSLLGTAFAAAVEQAETRSAAPAAILQTNAEKERQRVYEKLRSIRLTQWGPVDRIPLSDVVRRIREATPALDPEHKGVNFVIRQSVTASGDVIDINGRNVQLTNALKNVTLEEVLNKIVELVKPPIQYSVEGDQVIFSPKIEGPLGLDTTPEAKPLSEKKLLGKFFRADQEEAETKVAEAPEDIRIRVAKLVQDGKLYYETGRLKEAEDALHAALKLDPANQAAMYYVGLLAARRDASGWFARTNAAPMSKERQELYQKLRSIKLSEWGPIDNLPLSEVVRGLSEAARRLDPERKGVGFIFNPNPTPGPGIVDGSGLPVAKTDEGIALKATAIRLGTVLTNITLEEALDTLMMVADRKIQYAVEDYGVIISPKVDGPVVLHTRFFKVDPNTFVQKLQSLVGFDFKTGQTNRPFSSRLSDSRGSQTGTTNSNGASVIPAVQSFFRAAGIDMTAAGKTVFYGDRLGVLTVRATLQDLDTIEKAIQLLNMSPPQLTIHVKVMEVPVSSAAENSVLFGLTKQFPTNVLPNSAITNSGPPSVQGILTPDQFQSFIHALEKNGGSDLLSAPQVTTMSGRQAQIKTVDVRYIVTDIDYEPNEAARKSAAADVAVKRRFLEEQRRRVETRTLPPLELKLAEAELAQAERRLAEAERQVQPLAEPFEIGPVVDVVPYVESDGYTIQMTVMPKLREFLGYDDPGEFVVGDSKTVQQPVPLPRFRVRETVTTARVWDGQTLVIGAGTARHVSSEKNPDGTSKTVHADKALFFFITPRLIDPAGNRLHSDDQMPFAKQGVPKQNGSAKP